MSLYDYRRAVAIHRDGEPFYALVMALSFKADEHNLAKLRAAWPETVAEGQARYNAPGGRLAGETREIHG